MATTMARDQGLKQFEAWMRTVGIWWDTDLCTLAGGADGCSGKAYGVFAARDVRDGDILCRIPHSAILSIKTTGFADVIKKAKLGGGLGLIAAVMYEWGMGEKSHWHGYFQSLPAREYLPIFWSPEELALLQGSELEGRPEEDLCNMREDFDSHLAPLLAAFPKRLQPATWTFDRFCAAASWVASRAFFVDEHHGEALVPLADVFNHKPSVVALDGHEVAETAAGGGEHDDDDDGGAGGEEDTSGDMEVDEGEDEDEDEMEEAEDEAEDEGSGSESESESDGEAPEAVPMGGKVDGGKAEGEAEGAEGGGEEQREYSWVKDGVPLKLEIAICSSECAGEPVLEIQAASAVRAGAEIHNTYGEHGSCELVAKYGFALRGNPFSEVQLDKEGLLAAALALQDRKELKLRRRFLEESTDLLEGSDVEPFCVTPHGRLSRGLLVALRVLLAPKEDFECWGGIMDVVAELELELGEQQGQAAGRQAAGGQQQQQQQGSKKKRPRAAGDDQSEEAAAGAGSKRSKTGSATAEQPPSVVNGSADADADADADVPAAAGSGGSSQGQEADLPLHPAIEDRFDHYVDLAQHAQQLSPAVAGIIRQALLQRLARYPEGLVVPQELQHMAKAAAAVAAAAKAGACSGKAKKAGKAAAKKGLQQVQAGGAGGDAGEHEAAVRAAQVLRLSEQEMLLQALELLPEQA